jgi:hypothetical protein
LLNYIVDLIVLILILFWQWFKDNFCFIDELRISSFYVFFVYLKSSMFLSYFLILELEDNSMIFFILLSLGEVYN